MLVLSICQVKTEEEQTKDKGKDKSPDVKTVKTEKGQGEEEKLDFSSGVLAKGGIAAQKLSYQIANSATVTAKVEF